MNDIRLDRPPPAGSAIELPDDFGRRFCLLGDAEEEFDWTRPLSRAQTATTALAALPAATRRFVDRGVVPTWLVDWPVAERGDVLAPLVADGLCDIGAQLHPWVNPPHDELVSGSNSFCGNLPIDLERAKIARLTDRIVETCGAMPVAFRAGRYGVGPNTGAILADLGYRLDVSTRPLFDYSAEGGPDFGLHPVHPWRARGLIELPLTAAQIGPLRRLPYPRSAMARRVLARSGLMQRVALTPEDMPLPAVLRAIDALLGDGVRLFSLSFHTPSLVPGHTPYVRDAADLDAFWRWWDAVLDRFARAGVTVVRPAEIVAAADACQPPPGPAIGSTGPVAQR